MNARLQYDQERTAHSQGDPPDGYLTSSEQQLLLYYYQRRISEFAAGFNLPISVVVRIAASFLLFNATLVVSHFWTRCSFSY